MLYDVGDAVRLSTTVRDADGALTAATVTILITKPSGATVAPVTSTPSTGVYRATATVDQAGLWRYTWSVAGAVTAVEPGQFTVATARALVASVEEVKAQLNKTGTDDDDELRSYLVAATDWVERYVGGPLGVRTVTETVRVRGDRIVLAQRPVVSVISITPRVGTVLDVSAYNLGDGSSTVYLPYGADGQYTVVYTAGTANPPESWRLAGLIIVQHLWTTQNGGGGLPFPGDDTMVGPGMSFAVPRRAIELLRWDHMPGIA